LSHFAAISAIPRQCNHQKTRFDREVLCAGSVLADFLIIASAAQSDLGAA
jgi:hypothetical protein